MLTLMLIIPSSSATGAIPSAHLELVQVSPLAQFTKRVLEALEALRP